MKDLETNKIFAAILVAGIVAAAGHFIGEKVVNPSLVKAPGAEAAADSGSGEEAPEEAQPIDAMIEKGDPAKGEQIAKVCASCHTFDKGGANGIGPNLWNILPRGRAAGAGYSYSDATAKHKGETWTYLELNKWLWSPMGDVPGTKMSFAGIKKPQDRANVIAYLRTLADAPMPMPSAADEAAEAKALGPKTLATAPGASGNASPATAPNNTSAPAGEKGAAATPVTNAKPAGAPVENATEQKSTTPQSTAGAATPPAQAQPATPPADNVMPSPDLGK